eukprot:PhF_6_TR6090/c3_g1_i3/m.8908/K03163/TOP1; DNA topoisomerase I
MMTMRTFTVTSLLAGPRSCPNEPEMKKKREIRSLKECNFDDIMHHVRHNQRSQRIKRDDDEERYRFCHVDGVRAPVVECGTISHGICCGDKDAPCGVYRHRLMPEDVTVNCGVGDVPPAPPAGHHWREVIHDPRSWWVCTWYDEVSKSNKYARVGNHDVDHHTRSRNSNNNNNNVLKTSNTRMLLSRSLNVLGITQQEHYVCPNDVSWSIIDLCTYFDIHSASVSHSMQHPNMAWPLGMATLFDRYLLIADYKNHSIHLWDMR